MSEREACIAAVADRARAAMAAGATLDDVLRAFRTEDELGAIESMPGRPPPRGQPSFASYATSPISCCCILFARHWRAKQCSTGDLLILGSVFCAIRPKPPVNV